jgi:hypothetical protein
VPPGRARRSAGDANDDGVLAGRPGACDSGRLRRLQGRQGRPRATRTPAPPRAWRARCPTSPRRRRAGDARAGHHHRQLDDRDSGLSHVLRGRALQHQRAHITVTREGAGPYPRRGPGVAHQRARPGLRQEAPGGHRSGVGRAAGARPPVRAAPCGAL